MRRIRGNEIAMIFQEPMTSLNPAFTVGNQIAEQVRAHRDVTPGRRPGTAPWTCSTRWGSPTPSAGPATTRTPSPAGCANGP